MQITKEMIVAAWIGWRECSHKNKNALGEDLMRAALEAALVARKVDANKLLSILRGECVFLDTTHTKQAADCIGELAEALKIARTVVDPARSPNTCDYIDATIEKWGLK